MILRGLLSVQSMVWILVQRGHRGCSARSYTNGTDERNDLACQRRQGPATRQLMTATGNTYKGRNIKVAKIHMTKLDA